MKKAIIFSLMAIALLSSFDSNAQRHKKDYLTFKPYLGVGASLSTNYVTPGAEFGFYNDKMWFAVGATSYQVNDDRKWSAQYKNYFKVIDAGIVENYAYYAINVSLEKGHQVGFEPGIATVFNVGKFSPQVSISFPTSENYPGWKPLSMSFGVGLNYWIK